MIPKIVIFIESIFSALFFGLFYRAPFFQKAGSKAKDKSTRYLIFVSILQCCSVTDPKLGAVQCIPLRIHVYLISKGFSENRTYVDDPTHCVETSWIHHSYQSELISVSVSWTLLCFFLGLLHSSFPAVHKVDNVGILCSALTSKYRWLYLFFSSILIENTMTNVKLEVVHKANIVNFVHYRETRFLPKLIVYHLEYEVIIAMTWPTISTPPLMPRQ